MCHPHTARNIPCLEINIPERMECWKREEGSFPLHHLLRVGGQKLTEVEEDYLRGTQLTEWYSRSPAEVHNQELSVIHKVGHFDFITPFSRWYLLLISFIPFYFTTVTQHKFMKKKSILNTTLYLEENYLNHVMSYR